MPEEKDIVQQADTERVKAEAQGDTVGADFWGGVKEGYLGTEDKSTGPRHVQPPIDASHPDVESFNNGLQEGLGETPAATAEKIDPDAEIARAKEAGDSEGAEFWSGVKTGLGAQEKPAPTRSSMPSSDAREGGSPVVPGSALDQLTEKPVAGPHVIGDVDGQK